MTHWRATDIPPQYGRSAVVTGTGGLGFEDALELARVGADVIIAGRNPDKGAQAVARILAQIPDASVRFEVMDLADLASVADFARRLADSQDSLDILINNAGVMAPPHRLQTKDGFELQLGVNYLGHFALTAQLAPLLARGDRGLGDRARVVSLSSIAARLGVIDFDDLNARRNYRPRPVYAQSKLACLMFAFELQRRSDAAGWRIDSLAAHPGLSRTDLLMNAPGRERAGILGALRVLFQSPSRGALPTLFAATDRKAVPGGSYGPDGLLELGGHPGPSRIPRAALDAEVAARLWRISEELTQVGFG